MLLVTRGFGNGTLIGTIAKASTRGYIFAAAPINIIIDTIRLTAEINRSMSLVSEINRSISLKVEA